MGATREAAAILAVPVRHRIARRLWWFARRKPLGFTGVFILVAMVVLAIGAPLFAPYPPNELHGEAVYAAPSREFVLGTDDYGRDILSRIIYGSRVSIPIGFASLALGSVTGALVGLVSGYWGGRLDLFVQRLVDMLMAFPALVLAMVLMFALSPSLITLTIAIAITMLPRTARVVRSAAISAKEMTYVMAAKAIGCRDLRIIFRHVLPNCVAPYLIIASALLGAAILLEASLSFLGLGVPPPNPTWGQMLSGALGALRYAPWVPLFPGIALTLTVFGINLLGDALRDILDPRLRGT